MLQDGSKPIDFVDFIRKQDCIICFKNPVDPDHLKAIGMGRNRKNEYLLEHYTCIPLCRYHHRERHDKTLRDFEDKYKVNLWFENHRYLVRFIQKKGTLEATPKSPF